jgi:hypothetical protein
MSFACHLQHTPTGLALTFAAPTDRIDMTAVVAAHLASLLLTEARSHNHEGCGSGPLESPMITAIAPRRSVRNARLGTTDDLSLLAIEARSQVAGVVRTLTAENASTSLLPMQGHPNCCDCDGCLNGDA